MNMLTFFSKRFFIVFWTILLLGLGLRLYQIGSVPHGMTWDEAAIGYNGLSVWSVRRDEWLTKLPISFRSFGDYKAPLAIYITGAFTTLFGLELWVIRLPFVLAGTVGIGCWMLLVAELLKEIVPDEQRKTFALMSGACLAFSPWHLHFTRLGFESGMALSFVLFAVYSLVRLLKTSENQKNRLANYVFAMATSIGLVAALYTYHSVKIALPFLIVGLLGYYWKSLWAKRNLLGVVCVFSALLLLPLAKDTFLGKGGERFQQASIFSQKLAPKQLITQLTQNTFANFAPGFLVLGQTTTLRHGDGKWGVLFPVTFMFVLLSFLTLRTAHSQRKKLFWFSFFWVIIGTLPAIIGVDSPHSNRALLALPGYLLLELLGVIQVGEVLWRSPLNKKLSGSKGEENLLVKSIVGIALMVQILCFVAYVHSYYFLFAKASALDFSDGYIELMTYLKNHEDEVEKIVVTSKLGQPYIYALIARGTSPIAYHNGSLVKYEFRDAVSVGDLTRKNALVVGTAEELDPRIGEKQIIGTDGKVVFVVVRTKNE